MGDGMSQRRPCPRRSPGSALPSPRQIRPSVPSVSRRLPAGRPAAPRDGLGAWRRGRGGPTLRGTPARFPVPFADAPRPLGAVLDELIDRLGYRAAMDEARAVEAWPAVAGPAVAGVTERAWMRDGRLFVKVRSAPWRHQLHLQREGWRARLNRPLGRAVVAEVVFC